MIWKKSSIFSFRKIHFPKISKRHYTRNLWSKSTYKVASYVEYFLPKAKNTIIFPSDLTIALWITSQFRFSPNIRLVSLVHYGHLKLKVCTFYMDRRGGALEWFFCNEFWIFNGQTSYPLQSFTKIISSPKKRNSMRNWVIDRPSMIKS